MPIRKWALPIANVVGLIACVAPGAAFALSGHPIKLMGQEYDPGKECVANAEWVQGIGLPGDPTDRADTGFILQKQCPTSTNASSIGVFKFNRLKPLMLDDIPQLGFDFKNDDDGVLANCNGGATYFQLLVSDGADGNYFYFGPGCQEEGLQQVDTPIDGWTRVRISLDRFTPQFRCNRKCTEFIDGEVPPITDLPGNAHVTFLQLAFDQGPDQSPNSEDSHIVLDNILVGDEVIGRGKAKRPSSH